MLIRDFTDKEISETIFTLLFASQDATSSAMTWLFQYLADRPDILDKVREEQLAIRDGDRNKPFDIDLLESAKYTSYVVKEILRLRPPVIMVPYMAKQSFQLSPDYTVPKGAMVIPTLYPALHDPEAYPEPETFKPERWSPEGGAEKHTKNWLVFGTGPHVCLGQQYVMLHLIACAGKASLCMDWEHTVTPLSEKIKVFATIFPQDDCLLQFKSRA